MNCPSCTETLLMTERQGIEIDYCPKCRGVWLDKGELDKIIEKTLDGQRPVKSQPDQYQQNKNYNDTYNQEDEEEGQHGSKHGGKNKQGRKGFLGDLFDF